MTYGYIRVSTDAQDCQNQKIGINELAARLGLHVDKWIEDSGVSGMKDPKKRNLGKLMKMLKEGDHLLVSEISRLSRELFMIFAILKGFSERGIKLNTVKDNYVLDGSITSKVLAFAFGMAANIERDMISKRTIEGLRARRNAGVLIGRPLGTKNAKKKLDAKEADIKRYLKSGISFAGIARLTHTHRLTVSRICKDYGWDKEYCARKNHPCMPPHLRAARMTKKLDINFDELLCMYREHKSLTKIATMLDCYPSKLKQHIQAHGWWDKLIELDNELRLAFPSINRQAAIYKTNTDNGRVL